MGTCKEGKIQSPESAVQKGKALRFGTAEETHNVGCSNCKPLKPKTVNLFNKSPPISPTFSCISNVFVLHSHLTLQI